MRFHALAAFVIALSIFHAQAAEPLVIWTLQPQSKEKSPPLSEQIEAIAKASKGLPDALGPAVQFQNVYLKIVAGWKPSEWRGEIETLCGLPGDSPVVAGVREVSRAWLARLHMAEIDLVLRAYYRSHVRFPDNLSEIENDLPKNLRNDPWGDPWLYKPHAPRGFGRLAAQRYQLAPSRIPNLSTLPEAGTRPVPQPHSWTVTLHEEAEKKALEFRSQEKGAPISILDCGGKIEGCTLLFIGDGWALMAGVDQLFAVTPAAKSK